MAERPSGLIKSYLPQRTRTRMRTGARRRLIDPIDAPQRVVKDGRFNPISEGDTSSSQRPKLRARLQFFSLFLGVYIKVEFGNMTTYQQSVGACTSTSTHTKGRPRTGRRAIITLLRHTRRSSGKPRGDRAERRVNRKVVTQILAASHALRRGSAINRGFTHIKPEEALFV